MPSNRVVETQNPSGFAAIAGLRISAILSADLFRQAAGIPSAAFAAALGAECHDRWTDLANLLAAIPEPFEILLVAASRGSVARASRPDPLLGLLAVGRGDSPEAASGRVIAALQSLEKIVTSTLDFIEVEALEDDDEFDLLLGWAGASHVVELRRRLERFTLDQQALLRQEIGFSSEPVPPVPLVAGADDLLSLVHLFPWVPSYDPWLRLLEVLRGEAFPASFVVHARGFSRAPESCVRAGRAALATAERIAELKEGRSGLAEGVLFAEAQVLQKETLGRLVILEGRVIAARVFIAAQQGPSSELLGTILDSIDDASTATGQPVAESALRGGARTRTARSTEILEALDEPELDLLFSPREASAILRTPMPRNAEVPGLTVRRARTFRITGATGDDAPLGINVHKGVHIPVAMDDGARFRHTYVIGQTGTGKSTMLLRMIIHDISRGWGVALLDAHGSLVEEVLSRIPPARADDVVLVDVTDDEHPIGFNVLRIDEDDPHEYRRLRDLLIDDLYGYIDRTYDLKQAGGPIFETHFRGMLALLLGTKRPPSERIPNLMVFRSLYANEKLRSRLVRDAGEEDLVLSEFIQEALAARGEGDIKNLAPYVTSKFSRFVADAGLRNITCQKETLDLGRIVEERKILLFHLGKGRFGDYAAGLLASQVLARIRNAVMRRGPNPEAVPFYLYADEFQLVADERFAELLAEARKFRLSLTLAHQYVEQVPERVHKAVLGNVGTVVTLRVGARDGQILEPLFQPVFDAGDLASQANFRACVRSSGSLGPVPFSVELPLQAAGDGRLAQEIRTQSSGKYARARETVEQEISDTYKAFAAYGRG